MQHTMITPPNPCAGRRLSTCIRKTGRLHRTWKSDEMSTALSVALNASFFFTKASSTLMHLCHRTTHINITILSPFSIWLITRRFSSIPIVFRRFFTWIALGDVDLRLFLAKAIAVEGELHQPHNCITNITHTCGWFRASDVTLYKTPQRGKCGQRSSMPHRVKAKLTA
jgi:hypothetical protein